MPGMDMSGDADMKNMGPSMAAMAGHMYMTPLRPPQPGDMEKAKAVVATLRATMERYKDYRKALADGYSIAGPEIKQPQYHFLNKANERDANDRVRSEQADSSSVPPHSHAGIQARGRDVYS